MPKPRGAWAAPDPTDAAIMAGKKGSTEGRDGRRER